MRPLLILILFVLAPVGAWAWYHVGTRPPEVAYEFLVSTNVPGLRFTPLPLGAKEMDMLATTNLINGEFTDGNRKLTVFAAEWRGESAKELSVVQHTPDACWVGAGFTPVDLGQPMSWTFDVGGVPVPFECRVFEFRGRHELTFWSTLLSGRFMEEGSRFRPAAGAYTGASGWLEKAIRGRMLAAGQFIGAVSRRQPADGTKQFLRFSTPMEAGWESALARVTNQIPEWLEVKATRTVQAGTGSQGPQGIQ